MNINLSLLEKDNQINKLILSSLSDEINSVFKLSLSSILSSTKNLIKNALISQPEYNALKSGQLRFEFGIPNADNIDSIIDTMCNTTIIDFRPVNFNSNSLSGGFIITFLDNNALDSIISSSEASVQDSDGYSLPWLRWLLNEGVKPIVKSYKVKMGPNNRSRTGMAIMVKSNSSWTVPPQYAGTSSNNWISRAINDIDDSRILSIIQSEIEKNI